MTFRFAYQIVALLINVLIVITSVWITVIDLKRWPVQGKWILYGLVGTIFYTVVVVFGNGNFGNDFSPVRTMIQDTLVLLAVFFGLLEVIRRKHG